MLKEEISILGPSSLVNEHSRSYRSPNKSSISRALVVNNQRRSLVEEVQPKQQLIRPSVGKRAVAAAVAVIS